MLNYRLTCLDAAAPQTSEAPLGPRTLASREGKMLVRDNLLRNDTGRSEETPLGESCYPLCKE